jgi:hypothetical protein
MRVAYAAIFVAALAWAAPVFAQKDEEAAAHYKKGRSLYNVSEYRPALEEFKQAYVLHEDPAFLYNIAQCHRQLGNHREAITFYKRFLNESPRAPNRREIERLIGELEEKAAKNAKSETSPAKPAEAPVPVASEPPAPRQEPAPAPPAPPPPPAEQAPARAGLHLELGAGLGVLHDSFEWLALTRGTATGLSGSFHLGATYGVIPRLALGLVFAAESVQSPRVEVSGVRTDNVSVGTLAFLGVLADWRPTAGPTGWHLQLGLGGARLKIEDKQSVLAARTPVGGGGLLAVGHDWSMNEDWHLGFLVRVMGVALSADNTDHRVVTASAMLVAGWH